MFATKAAVGAANPRKDITMATNDDPEFEPVHDSSPTDHVLTELQLYGHRPFQDEPDPRPLPDAQVIAGAVADIFDALVSTLGDTRLEPDLEDLLWSTANLFHRSVERIERELDNNEQAQRRSQRDQNGSEIRSVELERESRVLSAVEYTRVLGPKFEQVRGRVPYALRRLCLTAGVQRPARMTGLRQSLR